MTTLTDEQHHALCRTLYEQATKCETANGGALLLSIKSFLEGRDPCVYDGCTELWQCADVIAGHSWSFINRERGRLIDKKANRSITAAEAIQLHALQEYADAYLSERYPHVEDINNCQGW